jgi:5-methylcytosine-specific restriction endonuclease McrA
MTSFDFQRRMHPIPARVRFAVLKRAKARCERCGDTVHVELHHRTYYRHDGPYYGWPYYPDMPPLIFGHETTDDLLALCRTCHLNEHLDAFGDFCCDPEEAAASRWHEGPGPW